VNEHKKLDRRKPPNSTNRAKLQPRTSLAEWEAVPLSNALCRDMEDAARKIGYVLDPAKTAEIVAYVCGDAGIGKSHAIRVALRRAGKEGYFRIFNNYLDLIQAFETAAARRQPLILEESDQLLWSERQANVLKIATDAAGERVVHLKVRERDEDGMLVTVTKKIPLTAPLVVTSNKNLTDPSSFDSAMRPHVAALVSRSAPVLITGEREVQWEYACYLAICDRMLHKPDEKTSVAPDVQDKALAWFTTNLNRLVDGSPRTLKNVCKFISYNPERPDLWERDLRPMIGHPDAPDFVAPGGQPHVFLSEIAKERARAKSGGEAKRKWNGTAAGASGLARQLGATAAAVLSEMRASRQAVRPDALVMKLARLSGQQVPAPGLHGEVLDALDKLEDAGLIAPALTGRYAAWIATAS
jgi:hypothetical protein